MEWLARKGTVGETARTVGQQYLALKQKNPQEDLPKILGTVIMARGKAVRYSFDQFRDLTAAAADSETLTEFVASLVLIESGQSTAELGEGPLRAIFKAVRIEMAKLGLE